MTPKCRTKPRRTANNKGTHPFKSKPTAAWSRQSAKYIGLRVNRYGPPFTIVSEGRSGRTFVPASFITRSAQMASEAKIRPIAKDRGYLITRTGHAKCKRVLAATHPTKMSGGQPIMLGWSASCFDSTDSLLKILGLTTGKTRNKLAERYDTPPFLL